jgi:hypothetical protein
VVTRNLSKHFHHNKQKNRENLEKNKKAVEAHITGIALQLALTYLCLKKLRINLKNIIQVTRSGEIRESIRTLVTEKMDLHSKRNQSSGGHMAIKISILYLKEE